MVGVRAWAALRSLRLLHASVQRGMSVQLLKAVAMRGELNQLLYFFCCLRRLQNVK